LGSGTEDEFDQLIGDTETMRKLVPRRLVLPSCWSCLPSLDNNTSLTGESFLMMVTLLFAKINATRATTLTKSPLPRLFEVRVQRIIFIRTCTTHYSAWWKLHR